MSDNEKGGSIADQIEKTALTMMPADEAGSQGNDSGPQVTEVTMAGPAAANAPGGGESPMKTEMTMMQDSPESFASEVNKTTPCRPRTVSYGNLQPGDKIDRCVIVKKLGQGGMGSVYLARHETLGVFRAVKVLSGALYVRGGEFIKRFIQEAKIASSINHPNIVNVLDVGEDPERNFCYIIMEYVDGGTIRDVLRKTPRLSEVDALIVVESVAEALKAAAEQKIVHRDIKPDNIMLTSRGEVKLADLGIAKNTDDNVQLTKSHIMMGTPAYLAPEQAQDAHSVDVRADIYSLGATLYEMLTGQIPYPGKSTYDILAKLVSAPVPDPRSVTDTISAPTARLVMRMLAKQAKQRPGSAAELQREIRGLHVIPADLDKEKSIRDLLERTGAGNYSGDARTSTTGKPLSTWVMRNILLKAELFLRKLPLFSRWLDSMHRGGAVFYGSIAVFALILIGLPLTLFFSGRTVQEPAAPVRNNPVSISPAAVNLQGPSAGETAVAKPAETVKAASDAPGSVQTQTEAKKTQTAEQEQNQQKVREQARQEAERRRQEQARQEAERRRQEQARREEERRRQEQVRLEAERQRIAYANKAKKEREAREAKKIAVFAEITPAGATAVLLKENGAEIARQAVPENGKIEFNVNPGQYKLQVSASGFEPAERAFPVSDSRTISCVRINLNREMTRCTMHFYGSAKLLDHLRKHGVELRIDNELKGNVQQFPYTCDLTRQTHQIDIRGKGILTLHQVLKIDSDQTEIQMEFYLTGKDAVVEIGTGLKEKLEMNLFGIWEPMKKTVNLQPFHPVLLKWRAVGERNIETIRIPDLAPGSVHKITLARKEKAAVPGQAHFAEAEKLLKKGSAKDAVEKLKLAEKDGHPEAAYLLGELAEQGKGRWFASDEDAYACYKRAAQPPFNNPNAQLKMAVFHEEGRGGADRNIKTALEWYKKAADQKNPEALYRMGLAYKNGDGNLPVDYGLMVTCFTEAAELGHAEAQYQTGYNYENGIGVPVSVSKAKYWYQKAAEQGHDAARNRGKAL